ncbi:MAG: hypothetical protein EOP89_04820 [Lysobacteraceae bacterium]|nr:MAG: hypothetical protein EOP89_04820 [Xanthomonadaceae bacterium]
MNPPAGSYEWAFQVHDFPVALVPLFLLGLVVLTVGIRIMVNEFHRSDPPEQVDRFGYLLGVPAHAQCLVCGTAAKCTASFKRKNEVWTEWQCPRCMKL